MPSRNSSRRKSSPQKKVQRQKLVYKEMIKLQRTTHLLIRKLPFSRLVRDISLKINPEIQRWQANAILALQEAAEAWLVQYFQDSVLLAAHAHRVTVMPKDFFLLQTIKFSR